MKITIKGARTQDEGRRAYNAAWDFRRHRKAYERPAAKRTQKDDETSATWRFKLTPKGNVTATRIEAT